MTQICPLDDTRKYDIIVVPKQKPHDALICVTHTSFPYMRHDSFLCVTRIVSMRDDIRDSVIVAKKKSLGMHRNVVHYGSG